MINFNIASNFIRKKILISIFSFFVFTSFSFTQVYQTTELKEKAESEQKLKNKKENISEINKAQQKTADNPTFNYNLLSSNTFKAVQFEIDNYLNKVGVRKINEVEKELTKSSEQTDLFIDMDNNIFYRVNKKDNTFKTNLFHKEENTIQFDCKSCDFPPFKIEHLNNNSLNLLIPSQDEDIEVRVKYKFIKL